MKIGKTNLEMTYDSLVSNFNQNFDDTLVFIMEILCLEEESPNLEDYVNKMKQKVKSSTCQEHWNHDSVIARCLTCQKSSYSCICLKCFLNGNHEGHRACFIAANTGSCDCGDCTAWKPEGFCTNHKGSEENPDLIDLTSEQRERILLIFKACFKHFIYWIKFDPIKLSRVIEFLSKLVSIGDAYRRCAVIAIKESISMIKVIKAIRRLDKDIGEKLIYFLGSFSNDPIYRIYFSEQLFFNFSKLTVISCQQGLVEQPSLSLSLFFNIAFYAFQNNLHIIIKEDTDWPSIILNVLDTIWSYMRTNFRNDFMKNSLIYRLYDYVLSCIKEIINTPNYEQKSQKFALDLAEHMKQIECCVIDHYKIGEKQDDLDKIHNVVHSVCFRYCKLSYVINKSTKVPIKELFDIFYSQLIENFGLTNDPPIASVLSPTTTLSFMLPLHIEMIDSLVFCKENIEETISTLLNGKMSINNFCLAFSKFPIRYLATAMLQGYNQFARMPDSFILLLNNLYFKLNAKYILVPLFLILQTMLGITNDPNEFVLSIMTTFGLFSNFDDPNDTNGALLAFIHLLCCLLFDRHCIRREYFELNRLMIKTTLKESPKSFEEVESVSWYLGIIGRKYIDDMKSYTSSYRTPSGARLKSIDNSDWHPLVPTLKLSIILNAIGSNADSLLQFPEYKESPFGLNLRPVFTCSSLFAFEYQMLNNKNKIESTIMRYVCSLIVSTSSINEYHQNPNPKRFTANTFNELNEGFSSLSFSDFLQCKVAYKANEESSIIDLLQNLGKLGENTLVRMNIGYIPPESAPEFKEAQKKKIEDLKQSIMKSFKAKQDSFVQDTNVNEEEEECCVCMSHKDDVICYPVMSYDSFFPSILDSKLDPNYPQSLRVISGFYTCTHVMHFRCDQRGNNVLRFVCPMDRGLRSALLPKMQISVKPENENLKAAINAFTNQFNHNSSTWLISSLSGVIRLLEIRHRARPDVIDKPNTMISIRNLFWVLVNTYIPENDDFLDPTEQLIVKLVQNMFDFDEKLYIQYILEGIAGMNGIQLYVFLRRAALLQHFAYDTLITEKSSFIDWDSILDFSALCQRYEVQINDFNVELPIYRINLPKTFLEFIKPPFNVDMTQFVDKCYSIFTDEVINYADLQMYCYEKLKQTYCTFVFVSGKRSSLVFMYVPHFQKFIILHGIYVDEYGDEDIGFQKGSCLTLNEENLEKQIDYIYSGEWTNKLC